MELVILERLNSNGVTAYPMSKPQGALLPCVVMTRTGGAPMYADDGHVGMVEGRIQIECFADTYTAAKGLADSTKALLSALRDEGVITYMTLTNESDSRDTGSNAPEYPFRIVLDFNVLSSEDY